MPKTEERKNSCYIRNAVIERTATITRAQTYQRNPSRRDSSRTCSVRGMYPAAVFPGGVRDEKKHFYHSAFAAFSVPVLCDLSGRRGDGDAEIGGKGSEKKIYLRQTAAPASAWVMRYENVPPLRKDCTAGSGYRENNMS